MIVKNRSDSIVFYTIPDLNVRRDFNPGESKNISEEEIQKLSYQTGGMSLITDFLQIDRTDLNKIGLGDQEKEYFFSEADVKELILNGSRDEFLDALDFAPGGIIDLIKKYAVELPMYDMYKINALREKTGFDVAKAIENNEEDEVAAAPTRQRRVKEEKYKVVE